MKNLEYVTLEDGQVYYIIDEVTENNVTYLYLANKNDENDFCIRKMGNGKEIVKLDSNTEFDKALLCFAKKIQNEEK